MLNKIILIAVVFLIATSCSKEKSKNINRQNIDIGDLVRNYLVAKETEVDGIISITSRATAGAKNNGVYPDIMIDAKFFNKRDRTSSVNFGNLQIDEIGIPFIDVEKNSGYNIQSLTTSQNIQKNMMALFGKKNSVRISSNPLISAIASSTGNLARMRNNSGYDGFYVPAQIEMNAEFVQDYTIAINNATSVNWHPDPMNPSGTIMIGIINEGNYDDPNNPIPPEVVFFSEIPDNGYYVLTPSILQVLSSNGRATVFIARGNYEIITDPATTSQILIEALTYSTIAFIGVN